MTQLESAILEITSILDELHVPYMLIGGLAVSLWGEPRSTLDIHLSLLVEPAEFDSIVATLSARMHPLPQDALAFARETRVLPVVSSQGVRADLIFAALPMELEAIRRAQPMQVGGRMVNVASLEDLILMKLVSEREKDAEDARRLLVRFKGKIDCDYLEPRLSELAEALARPEILEVFLAGLQRDLQKQRPGPVETKPEEMFERGLLSQ
ncbi:MAG: DUF6036 family nucleotidyltransferase [Bryobacteraceae bacterium]|jgi:hypothetical protein